MSELARYQRFVNRDQHFWSPTQQAALETACELAGVEPTVDQAWHWKRQRGTAFVAWRSVSRRKRKALVRSAIGGAR